MERLKSGDFKKLSIEEQKEHRRMLRKRWLEKPGNLEKAKAANKAALHKHWLKKKNTLVEKICKQCGKKVMLGGNKTICDECHSKPSKWAEAKKQREERKVIKQYREEKVLQLASENMTQRQIADEVGTCQEVVSRILRKNGIHRQHHSKRAKDV